MKTGFVSVAFVLHHDRPEYFDMKHQLFERVHTLSSQVNSFDLVDVWIQMDMCKYSNIDSDINESSSEIGFANWIQ